MKLKPRAAARYQRAVHRWFESPIEVGTALPRCPDCERTLGLDGWSMVETAFVMLERWRCDACGLELVLREEWLQ
jgi:hypothetical protein